jgi:hypothetical protein
MGNHQGIVENPPSVARPDCAHLNIDWKALTYEMRIKHLTPESLDGVVVPKLVNWIIREVCNLMKSEVPKTRRLRISNAQPVAFHQACHTAAAHLLYQSPTCSTGSSPKKDQT